MTRREVPGKGCNYTVHPRTNLAPETASPPKGTAQTPEAASDKPSRTINTGTKVPYSEVQADFNLVARKAGFIVSQVLDASIRQTIRLRFKDHELDGLKRIFELAGDSAWLRGEGRESGWRPDLEYLLRPKTIRRLLEGSFGSEPDTTAGKWTPEQKAAYTARLQGEASPVGSIAKKILGGVSVQ